MKSHSSFLYSGSSQYGTYRVLDTIHDSRPARLLYGDDDSLQSGVALDDNPELLFDYNQRFLEMIMSRRPRNILIIGGGTCTFATAAHRLFPDLAIHVIEIDKLLIDLAYDFFELPRSPRLRLIVDDAVHYLATTSEQYDMIIIDAFFGYAVPPPLLRTDTIRHYYRHLVRGGVVAINIISEYKRSRPSLAHEAVASFSSVFSYTDVFQSDPGYDHGEEQNLILAASDKAVHFDYMRSEEIKPA